MGSGSTRALATEINGLTLDVGISCKSWFAIAHLLVVFCRAKSILTTTFANQTCNLAHVILTCLILGTVFIGCTFDTTATCKGITSESSLTATFWLVIPAYTLCITAAEISALASILTFRSTLGIYNTYLVNVAIGIGAAHQLLCTNVIEAVLEVWAARIAPAGRLTYSLDT